MQLSRKSLFAVTAIMMASVMCTTAVDPTPVASVLLLPLVDSLRVGGTRQLEVRIFDRVNNQLPPRRVRYNSNFPAIATIDSAGVLRGVSLGSVMISATVEGKVGTATWKIISGVDRVAIAPLTADVSLGSSRQLAANVLDADGNAISGRPVTWSSSNSSIATVSVQGLVSAVALGRAIITASVEGKTGSAVIDVVDPVASVRMSPQGLQVLRIGGRLQLTATPLNSSGQPLSGRVTNWASSNPNVASVNSTTGEVTAAAVGSATITAEIEGRSAQAAVNVTLIPVASVSITPTSLQMFRGEQRQLTLTSTDSTGATITNYQGRQVVFQSSNIPAATVTALGVVIAADSGTANVTATVDGMSSAPVVVTVKLVPVATVTVNPNPWSMACGATQQFVAVLRDANQNILVGRPVLWASSDTSRATITAAGVLTGKAAGALQVTATAESVVGLSNVTITATQPCP
jgi:uncharacterized protein YjdB